MLVWICGWHSHLTTAVASAPPSTTPFVLAATSWPRLSFSFSLHQLHQKGDSTINFADCFRSFLLFFFRLPLRIYVGSFFMPLDKVISVLGSPGCRSCQLNLTELWRTLQYPQAPRKWYKVSLEHWGWGLSGKMQMVEHIKILCTLHSIP